MKAKYWPIAILAAIFLNLLAALYTVYLSLDYPVENDESYFLPYQDVEKNYAQIKEIESKFLSEFALRPLGKITHLEVTKRPAILLENELIIQAKAKKNADLSTLQIRGKLTRPHTNSQDFDANFTKKGDKFYLDTSALSDGRWILLVQFSSLDAYKFYKLELCKNTCKR